MVVFLKWYSLKDFYRDMLLLWNKYLNGELGGTGTSNHASLTNLGYSYAGHTGFSPDGHTHTGYETPAGAQTKVDTHANITTQAHGGLLPSTSFSGLNKITVSITQPNSPTTGDLWVDIS